MKNLLILTYWSYKDALIQTYTLPYIRIIRKNLPQKSKIYLFTIEQEFFKMSNEDWQQEKEKLKKENIHLLRFKYSKFGFRMIFKFVRLFTSLFLLILTKKISTIHAWCTPAGAIAYILSVLTFRPLIIDSYEPHAIPMVESGTWNKSSLKFKILFILEKLQAKRAKYIIGCVSKMKEFAEETYNIRIINFYSKPACISINDFTPDLSVKNKLIKKYNLKDKVVCVYAGKFGGLYLENETFDFFKFCQEFWGNRFRVLLLTNHSQDEIINYCNFSKFDSNKIIRLFVNYNEVPNYMSLADFAIDPIKPIPSKRFATPIKTGEYWAIGLPVIITKDISDDSDIIEKEDIGYVLKELTPNEYKNAIKKIDNLLKEDQIILKQKIRTVAVKYRSFNIAEKIYNNIYGK